MESKYFEAKTLGANSGMQTLGSKFFLDENSGCNLGGTQKRSKFFWMQILLFRRSKDFWEQNLGRVFFREL